MPRRTSMKRLALRPLADQVVVITGASSGIGLVTARMAAPRGAAVVLAARNEEALVGAVQEIRAKGGRSTHVVADVGDREAVDRIAATAISEFGRFDTWFNNAAVSIFGQVDDVSETDMRRCRFRPATTRCKGEQRQVQEQTGWCRLRRERPPRSGAGRGKVSRAARGTGG